MPFVTDEHVQFGAGKPGNAELPAFCTAGEGLVLSDAHVVADGQGRRVGEVGAAGFARPAEGAQSGSRGDSERVQRLPRGSEYVLETEERITHFDVLMNHR
jgi:hypothetical protein